MVVGIFRDLMLGRMQGGIQGVFRWVMPICDIFALVFRYSADRASLVFRWGIQVGGVTEKSAMARL